MWVSQKVSDPLELKGGGGDVNPAWVLGTDLIFWKSRKSS